MIEQQNVVKSKGFIVEKVEQPVDSNLNNLIIDPPLQFNNPASTQFANVKPSKAMKLEETKVEQYIKPVESQQTKQAPPVA